MVLCIAFMLPTLAQAQKTGTELETSFEKLSEEWSQIQRALNHDLREIEVALAVHPISLSERKMLLENVRSTRESLAKFDEQLQTMRKIQHGELAPERPYVDQNDLLTAHIEELDKANLNFAMDAYYFLLKRQEIAPR